MKGWYVGAVWHEETQGIKRALLIWSVCYGIYGAVQYSWVGVLLSTRGCVSTGLGEHAAYLFFHDFLTAPLKFANNSPQDT